MKMNSLAWPINLIVTHFMSEIIHQCEDDLIAYSI